MSDWDGDWGRPSEPRTDQRFSATRPYPGPGLPGRQRGRGRGRGFSSQHSNASSRPNYSHRDSPRVDEAPIEWGADLGIKEEPKPVQVRPPTPPVADEFDDWGSAAKQVQELERQRWKSLGPVIKNFYIESPDVTKMTQEQVDQYRRDNNNITIEHMNADDKRPLLKPAPRFEDAFAAYPEILGEIEKNQFKSPSPIQAQSWPILLSGHDLIGIAQTGTGKTLAYLLPALIHIDGQTKPRQEREGPTALIIAPTRELAQQIEREAKKYSYRGIRTLCVYGGGDRALQIAQCEVGVEIVIATPGRLCDLIDAKKIKLTCVSYMVLDEADRMLDMGFEPAIRKITLSVNPDKQTVLMSATWPPGVRQLAEKHTQNPFLIYINSLDLAATSTVTQEVIAIDPKDKPQFLEDFVRSIGKDEKAIVFFARKADVDSAVTDVSLKGLIVQSMHGNRDQTSREEALADLKDGSARVLFATDLAARGIDVENITHILNYDFPRDIEEYVHRVGRSGRAGRRGKSITLITIHEKRHAEKLIEILERASEPVPEELIEMAKDYKAFLAKREAERASSGGSGGFRGRTGSRGGFSRPRW